MMAGLILGCRQHSNIWGGQGVLIRDRDGAGSSALPSRRAKRVSSRTGFVVIKIFTYCSSWTSVVHPPTRRPTGLGPLIL